MVSKSSYKREPWSVKSVWREIRQRCGRKCARVSRVWRTTLFIRTNIKYIIVLIGHTLFIPASILYYYPWRFCTLRCSNICFKYSQRLLDSIICNILVHTLTASVIVHCLYLTMPRLSTVCARLTCTCLVSTSPTTTYATVWIDHQCVSLLK